MTVNLNQDYIRCFFFSWELDEMMKIDATLASVH